MKETLRSYKLKKIINITKVARKLRIQIRRKESGTNARIQMN